MHHPRKISQKGSACNQKATPRQNDPSYHVQQPPRGMLIEVRAEEAVEHVAEVVEVPRG